MGRARIERLSALLAVALVAALAATLGAAATQASTTPPAANGFAGPVGSPPRAIDRDREPPARRHLHEVRCPVPAAIRCYVAGR